jgi:hypothetical protein
MLQSSKEDVLWGYWMMRRNLQAVSSEQGAVKEVIEKVKGTR